MALALAQVRTREVQKLLVWVPLFLSAMFFFGYLSGLHWQQGKLLDGDQHLVGIDFLNTWLMGQAGWHETAPEKNYDIAFYNDRLEAMFGFAYPVAQWSYPPNFMLLGALVGWMPYAIALGVFMGASFFMLAKATRRAVSVDWKRTLATILLSPMGYLAIISGQVTMALTAAQLTLFTQLDRRPLRAGMLLGLLSVKPQLGLMYPFFLLATRRYRVFVGAAITALGLVLLSALCFGWSMWDSYLTLGAPLQNRYVLDATPQLVQAYMPTSYMDLRLFGASYEVAMAGQAVVTLLMALLFFTRSFQRADAARQMLVVATASIAATPYLMVYDMLFFAAALVLWLRQQGLTRLGVTLCLLCFWMPVLHFLMVVLGLSGMAFLLPAMAVMLVIAPHRVAMSPT